MSVSLPHASYQAALSFTPIFVHTFYNYVLYALLATAASCPRPLAAQDQTTETQEAPTQQTPKSSVKKIALGIGVGIIVIGIVACFGHPYLQDQTPTKKGTPNVQSNGGTSGGTNGITSPPTPTHDDAPSDPQPTNTPNDNNQTPTSQPSQHDNTDPTSDQKLVSKNEDVSDNHVPSDEGHSKDPDDVIIELTPNW